MRHNFIVFNFLGIWSWIKNTMNNDLKQQLKNATDTVLTTLDPGMEGYLSKYLLLSFLTNRD